MEKLNKDKLRELLSSPQLVSDNTHFRADCPFCGKPQHFFINIKKQLWDCKKCGEDGNLKKLLLQLGEDKLLKRLEGARDTERVKLLDLLEEEDDDDLLEIYERQKNPIIKSIPAFTKEMVKGGKGWLYMVQSERQGGRGYEHWIINRLINEGILAENTFVGEWKDRVIFLIKEGTENVLGYVGRDITGNDERKKYLNSKKTNFSELLFGVEHVKKGDKVVLVEGVMDWIGFMQLRFHNKGYQNFKPVVTFGKKFSKKQALKLKYIYEVEDLIVFYDYDALKYVTQKLSKKDYMNLFNVEYAFMTVGDIGDAHYENIKNALAWRGDVENISQNYVPKTKLET